MEVATKNYWHLRISVLPQCNLRCRYCNPTGSFEKSSTLSDDEIIDIVRASVSNGIHRVHWTGGEPCIRNMLRIIKVSKQAGMIQQIMTTNGTLKADTIQAMHEAGLDRVNISLDTLNQKLFQTITGHDGLESVQKWIEQSCQTFSLVTKMNIVPMKDNIGEIPEFVKFAQQYAGKLALKFIELCPNNPAFYGQEIHEYAVNRQEIIAALERVGHLVYSQGIGDNPNAEFYVVGNTGVQVILITMPSHDFKCGRNACHKLRISPFGLAGSCIQQKGKNLLGLPLERKIEIIGDLMHLREGYSDDSPCSRRHFREDYGIWRFGLINGCEK